MPQKTGVPQGSPVNFARINKNARDARDARAANLQLRKSQNEQQITEAGLPYTGPGPFTSKFAHIKGLPLPPEDEHRSSPYNFENGRIMQGGSRKIKFIKNNKKYIRTIHIEKDKYYVIFENKKIPLSKLKIDKSS